MDADGGMTTTFASNDEVLAYIGDKILTPTWVDPVCGDGNCEYPWEISSLGSFWLQVSMLLVWNDCSAAAHKQI